MAEPAGAYPYTLESLIDADIWYRLHLPHVIRLQTKNSFKGFNLYCCAPVCDHTFLILAVLRLSFLTVALPPISIHHGTGRSCSFIIYLQRKGRSKEFPIWCPWFRSYSMGHPLALRTEHLWLGCHPNQWLCSDTYSWRSSLQYMVSLKYGPLDFLNIREHLY